MSGEFHLIRYSAVKAYICGKKAFQQSARGILHWHIEFQCYTCLLQKILGESQPYDRISISCDHDHVVFCDVRVEIFESHLEFLWFPSFIIKLLAEREISDQLPWFGSNGRFALYPDNHSTKLIRNFSEEIFYFIFFHIFSELISEKNLSFAYSLIYPFNLSS